jgi:hypothetical protein
MTLLVPKVEEIYPIGSVIESNAPPGNNWILCNGQVLSQSSYSILYALMDNPHPQLYSHWNFCDDYDSGGDYPYSERVQWNGGAVWVAAVHADGLYQRSTDGITWTIASFPTGGVWYGPAWNGSVFCALKYGASSGATSSDGSSWTGRTLPYSYNWQSVVWDGTNFIGIASNNTQTIKSTDGISWSANGVLSNTGFYYAASDGSGTIVAIDTGNEINYSINGGVTWTYVQGATGLWNSVEYCNGKFLIATSKSYVGVSDNGSDWEFLPYACDVIESIDNYGSTSAEITRWRYYDGIYFGLAKGTPWGVYSFDLRTFHPWFCNPHFSSQYDIVYNSSSGNLICFGSYGYAMPYTSKIEGYNESTHFQLPHYITKRYDKRGTHRYIRVN